MQRACPPWTPGDPPSIIPGSRAHRRRARRPQHPDRRPTRSTAISAVSPRRRPVFVVARAAPSPSFATREQPRLLARRLAGTHSSDRAADKAPLSTPSDASHADRSDGARRRRASLAHLLPSTARAPWTRRAPRPRITRGGGADRRRDDAHRGMRGALTRDLQRQATAREYCVSHGRRCRRHGRRA
jgi:hypothetical protein